MKLIPHSKNLPSSLAVFKKSTTLHSQRTNYKSPNYNILRENCQKRTVHRNKLGLWGFESTFQSAIWACHLIKLSNLSKYYLLRR